jgi:hypothetical protein
MKSLNSVIVLYNIRLNMNVRGNDEINPNIRTCGSKINRALPDRVPTPSPMRNVRIRLYVVLLMQDRNVIATDGAKLHAVITASPIPQTETQLQSLLNLLEFIGLKDEVQIQCSTAHRFQADGCFEQICEMSRHGFTMGDLDHMA